MSSVLLTPSDMIMIETLLAEIRRPEQSTPRDVAEEQMQFLKSAVECGIAKEKALRSLLACYVAIGDTVDSIAEQRMNLLTIADLAEWENEGGAKQSRLTQSFLESWNA